MLTDIDLLMDKDMEFVEVKTELLLPNINDSISDASHSNDIKEELCRIGREHGPANEFLEVEIKSEELDQKWDIEMDESEAGSSNHKRETSHFNDDRELSEEDEEDCYSSHSEDELDYQHSSDDFTDERDSDTEDVEVSNYGATLAVGTTWSDSSAGMNAFEFFKTNQLLAQPKGNKPIDYFRLLCDDTFLNLIVKYTNNYVDEMLRSVAISESSRITRWKPLTHPELLTFIALVLHTGTIKLNKLTDYWRTDRLFDFKCFSNHMSRDRFLLIFRCLHFCPYPDGGDKENKDRLFKIRPLLNHFNKRISDVYCPGKELTIDEPMTILRGRLIYCKYIGELGPQYGLKLYTLAEPNGVTLKILVNIGALDMEASQSHTAKVIMELMNEKLEYGHSLFLGRAYNSCHLANQLLNHQTYITGPLRRNLKGNSEEVVSTKIAEGETIARYSNGVMNGKWRNKYDMIYISTEYKNNMIQCVNKSQQTIKKPLPLFQYKKHGGGVDYLDKMLVYYPCEGNMLKWDKKLFLHILQLQLINAYHLSQKYSGKKQSLYDFRIELLVDLFNIKDKNNSPSPSKVGTHFPTKNTEKTKKGGTQRKRCRMCYKNSKLRKVSVYECVMCPEKPGLCPGKCFTDYHNQQ